MRHTELTTGRTFGLAFDDGEDFFTALATFCEGQGVQQGYIPMFLGGFRRVDLVGSCGPLEDPEAPVWDRITVETVEAVGAGTLAWDEHNGTVSPHIHVAVGLKADSTAGRTSHLLDAEVQFINELLLVEVLAPAMSRPRRTDLYDVPVLTFTDAD